jgi:hypothetical protein
LVVSSANAAYAASSVMSEKKSAFKANSTDGHSYAEYIIVSISVGHAEPDPAGAATIERVRVAMVTPHPGSIVIHSDTTQSTVHPDGLQQQTWLPAFDTESHTSRES